MGRVMEKKNNRIDEEMVRNGEAQRGLRQLQTEMEMK